MLPRYLLLLALLAGAVPALAAEPAAPAPASSPEVKSTPELADEDTAQDADEDAGTVSLDGEGFVPSVQISEDLSVSFPTDI